MPVALAPFESIPGRDPQVEELLAGVESHPHIVTVMERSRNIIIGHWS